MWLFSTLSELLLVHFEDLKYKKRNSLIEGIKILITNDLERIKIVMTNLFLSGQIVLQNIYDPQ